MPISGDLHPDTMKIGSEAIFEAVGTAPVSEAEVILGAMLWLEWRGDL